MFVPKDFIVPEGYSNDKFVVRPLLVSDVVKDYDAVMSSVAELQGIFGPRSSWPSYDLTFEQDLIDLGWHHKEFQRRSSFAYTVFSPDGGRCLGCSYLYPSNKAGYDGEAYCWVRADAAHLDDILYESFKDFLSGWPLENIAFPGRSPGWEEWDKISAE